MSPFETIFTYVDKYSAKLRTLQSASTTGEQSGLSPLVTTGNEHYEENKIMEASGSSDNFGRTFTAKAFL